MDTNIEDLPRQFSLDKMGGEGGIGDDMNWLNQWIKRKNRKKKIKSLIQDCTKKGNFNGTSGIELDFYIDCRPLIANSSTRITLIKALYEFIDPGNKVVFVGPQTSGAILATEMALFRNTNAIIINLNKNEVIYPYGIELCVKKIVLVDDVITTGYTLEKCIDLINRPIYKIISIVNRNDIQQIRNIQIESILWKRDIG